MDSFFKAAVCDLDKLLDDFELNTEELDCRSVFLKPAVFPFSSLGPQCVSEAPPNPPDLNSLHYGSAAGPGGQGREVRGQPLTAVDLLSSVDRRPALSSAPPCPDRALKPVCDLVNDAFGQLDAAERRLEEEQQEEEEEEVQEEALLVDFDSPVVMEASGHEQSGRYSLSLLDVILPAAAERSAETPEEDPSPPPPAQEEEEEVLENSIEHEQEAALSAVRETVKEPQEVEINGESGGADGVAVGLSCLPLAVSMCSALVKHKTCNEDSGPAEDSGPGPTPDEDSGPIANKDSGPTDGENPGLSAAKDSDPTVAENSGPTGDSGLTAAEDSGLTPYQDSGPTVAEDSGPTTAGDLGPTAAKNLCPIANEDLCPIAEPQEEPADASDSTEADREEPADLSQGPRASPEGQHLVLDPDPVPPESSLDDAPEFGFEYLPESDQAELLVTDEELDAFLQAHGHQAEGLDPEEARTCGGGGGPEDLRTCGGGGPEDLEGLEGLASPESDRTMSQDSCRPLGQEDQDQQTSYGGARPKQLPRSPPAGEEEEVRTPEEEEEEEEESSPSSLTDDQPNIRDLSPMYASQQPRGFAGAFAGAFDELSEPPPYPGDPPTDPPADGTRAPGWKRDGEDLGSRQPAWVPDAEAPNCMNCYQKFTFTRRRHHCRACGKVYCAVCCNRKCKLKYLEKEARVCVVCFDSIHRVQALERMMSPSGPSPNPNVPSEYCSTIPPLQQARAAGTLNSPPPTVMVPVSVLKQPHAEAPGPREAKRVWFADGILPNGEVADTSRLAAPSRRSSQEPDPPSETPTETNTAEVLDRAGSSPPEAPGPCEEVRPLTGPWDYGLLASLGSSVRRVSSLLPDNQEELPPLLMSTGEDGVGDVLVEESPAPCQILHLLEEGGPRPLTFILNANLLVNVKLITHGGRRCWSFGSLGLRALGQKELVFLLEVLPGEKSLPRDLFSLYLNVYQEAQKGKLLEELDNVTFTSSFLGSKEHAGMLFFSRSVQEEDGLTLPPPPLLYGLLVHRLEVPWAKVFPLRLLLRLGAEYDVYPTTLTSVRFRDSVYRETGHTIMNLLADLRNYQYSLVVVDGLKIHMEMGHSYIDIPKASYSQMQKVVNSSNEHVISVGARFSCEADSHLVCFQNQEGNYQTQANSKPGHTRTVTGASFVVFNGALKASSGFIAKSSIVEDGLMVQIPPETMESLRVSLRDQTDFSIPCGRSDGSEVTETVSVRWVEAQTAVNTGRTSGVDGRSLDGVCSVRLQQDTDFLSDGRCIRCTEVFYQPRSPGLGLDSVLESCGVFQKEMALAACGALTPHLSVLAASRINTLSLRISTQADMVEYQAGSGGRLLPQRYMNELDGGLIPVIHGGSSAPPQTAIDLEFVFYITHTV